MNARILKQIATPSIVRKVLRLKSERPSLFASEIRETLLSQRLCPPDQVPSVSSINRILREAATASSSLADEWPSLVANHMQFLHHQQMASNQVQHQMAGPSTSATFLMQLSSVAPSTSSDQVNSTPLDCSQATLKASESSSEPKRKKISYSIDDLLRK